MSEIRANSNVQQGTSAADFVWGLGSICSLLQIPFDATLLLRQFPPPYTASSLTRAAGALGLTAIVTSLDKAARLTQSGQEGPFFLGFSKDEDERGGSRRLILIGRMETDRVVCFRPDDADPQYIALANLDTSVDALIIAFGRRMGDESTVTDDNAGDRRTNCSDGTPGFGYRWFAKELLRHQGIWRDVLVASCAIQLIALATPLFTQIVIDKVVVHHTRSTLIAIGVGMLIFTVFTAALTWIRQYLVLHTGNRVDAALGGAVFDHLLGLPQRYFESRPTGVVAARLHGVETVREFISSTAVTLILDMPFLVLFLAIMFWYSVALTLFALGVVVAITALSALLAPTFRKRLNHQFLLGARNQGFLTEYISGMETVKSLQMEPLLKRNYREYLATYLKAGFDVKQVGNAYSVTSSALDQLLTIGILVLGATLVMGDGGFTIGMLVAFQMFASRISQPILRTVGLWQQFQQANIAVRRLGDILDVPTEPFSIVPQVLHSDTQSSRIEFSGVSFRYSEMSPYLYRELNIAVERNTIHAIVGPSGSGKSTLTKLLLGFRAPTSGKITVDGRGIGTFPANALRAYFGVVPQETTLFAGTVYQNLHMADPNASFEDIISACVAAEIHDTIEGLPHGYQTELGERGIGLSGGQKQRISIARALIKQPRVLIFDEATSGLDADTSDRIAQTINRIAEGVTTIFISHDVPKALNVSHTTNLRFALPGNVVQMAA